MSVVRCVALGVRLEDRLRADSSWASINTAIMKGRERRGRIVQVIVSGGATRVLNNIEKLRQCGPVRPSRNYLQDSTCLTPVLGHRKPQHRVELFGTVCRYGKRAKRGRKHFPQV